MANPEQKKGFIQRTVEISKFADYAGIIYGVVTGSIGIVLASLAFLGGKQLYLNRKKK